jgi:two-component system CheB/CheR fusion protein
VHRDFSVINAKHKIYRVLRPVSLPLDFRTATRKDVPLRTSSARREIVQNPEGSIIEAGLSQLIKRYTPPALLLNADRELLHVYGDAQRFMQIPEGTVSLDISKLLIGKLAPVGVALLHKSAKENAELQSEIHLVEPNKALNDLIRVIVRPITTQGSVERYFLMLFETLAQSSAKLIGVETVDIALVSADRIQSLERDLSATRDSLQATIEELETANEELQATNEELMASNEELQSTNEELQSVNEELYTVNSENQEKIEILNRLNTDLDNMTRAALIPTVFVDATLKLTRFTPEAGRIFRIREGDIGRPIDDFTHDMDYPEFLTDIRQVIQTAQLVEREVSTKDGRWYVARALPYIDRPRNINGAVLTFFEISQIKDAQRLQAILDSLPEHIATLDLNGVIVLVNTAWRDLAEKTSERSLVRASPGMNYLNYCRTNDGVDVETSEAVLAGIGQVLAGESKEFSITYQCHSVTEKRWFLMHAAPVRHIAGGVVVSHINITPWIGGSHE